MRTRNLFLIVLMSLLCAEMMQAQGPPYQLALSSVTGGGGDVANANYSVQFTMAEPVQGEGTSPSFSVYAGFLTPATLLSSTLSISKQLDSRWNLVSLPLHVEDPRRSIVFPQAETNAFSFLQEGGYQSQDTLDYGIGYWIKLSPHATATIVGLPRSLDTIEIVQGWNLVGSLSRTIGVDEIETIPSGILSTYFYGYHNSYFAVDSLEPMEGYWIKAHQDGALILGESGNALSFVARRSISETIQKSNTLIVRDKLGNQQELRFTLDNLVEDEPSNFSLFELPPLPPKGIFDVRFSNNQTMNLFVRGVRNQSIDVLLQSYIPPLEISWNVSEDNSGPSYLISGKNINMAKLQQLQGTGEILINNPLVTQLTLMSINDRVDKMLPNSYSLQQNYPNPFNPSSMINFELPTDSKVSLKVYDLLGRVVNTLVDNQDYEAGYQQVVFNAGNLASGMYFYRLTAQSEGKTFTDVKKMLLLK